MISAQHLRIEVGGRTLLRDASFEVARDETVVLAGKSGSGKSTLLKTLLGLPPRASRWNIQGTARIAGMDARTTPTPQLARKTGLLFQDVANQLVQPDVEAELTFRLENLGLPRRDVEERCARAIRTSSLEPLLGQPLASLSGGELKRTALASLRAAEPAAFLLDEPLGSLDDAWRKRTIAWLHNPGASAFVAEHRLDELRGLRTLHLHEGNLDATLDATATSPTLLASSRHPSATPATRAARTLRESRESPWPVAVAEGLRVDLGGRAILDDATFDVQPGITLVLGPNGAGKSTLLRALLGLVERSAGTLSVRGLDPAVAPLRRLAREVGFVGQQAEAMFFATSAREELEFGLRNLTGRIDQARIDELASALGLAHLLDRHPFTLSGGERQRLAIACALAHGPKLLLLDEPTVGLDAAGLARLRNVLAIRGAPVAVLIATHDAELLSLADHALVLRDGRVVEPGATHRRAAPRLVAA